MASTGEAGLGRRPELDGLRGIAIGLVLVSHFRLIPDAPSSGAVGVAVFFTLSGYLITGLLLAEHERSGRIRLRRFFNRRARRLAPALVAAVVVTVALGDADPWAVFATLTYWSNWLQALSPEHIEQNLSHTWSLGIEEQFYLLWPLVVIAAFARRRWVVAAAVLGSLGAVVMRLVMWDDGAGFWRAYFGLDTRADGLLIGCALAALGARRIPALWLIPALGLIGFAATISSSGSFVIIWTPLLVSLATAVCIAARPTRALSVRPLGWLGRRAYGLYLWHVVVLGLELPTPVALACSLALAEVSWRLIEAPFLRQRVGVAGPDPAVGVVVGPTDLESRVRPVGESGEGRHAGAVRSGSGDG